MLKLKLKIGTKNKPNLGEQLQTRAKVIEETVKNIPSVVQPEVKEKKIKTPPRKVVYITKRGSKAVFDSIALCAKIFGKDKTTIKYRIEHPKAKAALDFDWLEGGRLEYIND